MIKVLGTCILLLIVFSDKLDASANDFSISLGHNSAREKAAEKQLRRLLDQYDVSRFSFTYSIRINQGDVPHSHPVLTLNTVHLGDDKNALSTLLHEQLHWHSLIKESATARAISDLQKIYPNVPVGGGEGARDIYSTYMHLIVCLQEFDALASYIGRDEAKQVLSGKRHYRWIYKQVLENSEKLRAVLQHHGINDPVI